MKNCPCNCKHKQIDWSRDATVATCTLVGKIITSRSDDNGFLRFFPKWACSNTEQEVRDGQVSKVG